MISRYPVLEEGLQMVLPIGWFLLDMKRNTVCTYKECLPPHIETMQWMIGILFVFC